MLQLNICVSLLALSGIILAEDQARHGESLQETGRLGFSMLEQLRRSFCHSFCVSADTHTYIWNIICAAKCPELYLPHGTTTKQPESTTPLQPTTLGSTVPAETSTISSTTMPSVATPNITGANDTAANNTGRKLLL